MNRLAPKPGRGSKHLPERWCAAAKRRQGDSHGNPHEFGRTAELVRTAHVVSSQQKAVLRVVRNLAAFNGTLIVILLAYALRSHASRE